MAIGPANDQSNQSNHVVYGTIRACRQANIARLEIDHIQSCDQRIKMNK